MAEDAQEVQGLPVRTFLHSIWESSQNGKRFCYILGAGASVESDIPSGIQLARRWAGELKEQRERDEQEFKAIQNALNIKDEQLMPSSENYSSLFKLRFFPDDNNGYAYLQKVMERGKPSYGYYPLAMQLAQSANNLVITTNFDSLVEDALSIYTDKKPIVVGHELLADYININEKRPLIAKIHRGLFFKPMNREEE